MSRVTIIDYGVGNLLSVRRAFEHFGAEIVIADSVEKIEQAESLVLPGVGAFADGMAALRERGYIEPIKEYSLQNRPFLGICLGMQMMLEVGEEFGIHKGLGLIPGKVTKIPNTGINRQMHKIPHIGWNALKLPIAESNWDNSILFGINQGEEVYFVHSFSVVPESEKNRLADCIYDGRILSAVIQSGNLYGCQFHPEKSGAVGLKIINNFLSIINK